jgi:ABC-type sugar transport system substrate-binding protein
MKRIVLLFSLLLVLALAVACGGAAEETAEEVAPTTEAAVEEAGEEVAEEVAAPGDVGDQLYVFLPKSLDNPYWDDCRKGMEDLAAELGVQAEFLGPDTADAAKQVGIFESVIARQPAGIAVSPNDPATVTAAIAAAMEAGIPVFAWDADAPESERIAYIGTNNVNAGRTAGEELAKAIGGAGQVAILHGSLTAANANERVQGFLEAMENYPDIEVVATEPTEDSLATALSKAEQLLQAYPDLKAFYGVTGSGVPGASGAVKQANKCGEVQVIGFDVVPQGIEAMREGCAQVLISQRPYGMTQLTLQTMFDLHNNGTQPAEEFIDTGVEVVYPDTLEAFLETPH